jgi:hypothetical protein
MQHEPQPWWAYALEAGAAVLVALLASYVRPMPGGVMTVAAALSRAADAVVCGFLAIGAAAGIEAMFDVADPRVTTGIAAAAGLVGTTALTEMIMRVAERRTAKL